MSKFPSPVLRRLQSSSTHEVRLVIMLFYMLKFNTSQLFRCLIICCTSNDYLLIVRST